ncbi:MAG: DUF1508 domain-containing protein [Saprospiraceae bacterium]|nr:DUF1508 domain-containing protein [Saprospiraceae bacterium]
MKKDLVLKPIMVLTFLVLKAGNHQEIARTCPFSTEAEALAYLPSQRSKVNSAIITSTDQISDDYLICREYQENVDKSNIDKDGFIKFQHDHTHKYYFSWVTQDGEIILRSEGYPTASARDKGMESVKKNRDIRERFKVEEHHGAYFLILKAGNNQEIGRSCPKESEAALWALLGPKVEAPIAAIAAATIVTPIVSAVVPNVVAKEEKTVVSAPAVADNSGFNWWWLLPLLLLIPLIFWYKSCGNTSSVSVVAPVQDTMIQTTTIADTAVAKTPPAIPSCDLNWILFDFNKYVINSSANTELLEMAGILKENPTYKGILKAFTDARGSDEYNQRLSENRANAAKDILIGAGIDVNRLSITASSETDPIAINTDDDSGRHFNRRVELYIQDENGKDICKSIAPEVPADLKIK